METPENITYIAMSLIFLLLGVVLISSILSVLVNPYDQIALANTEKLASAISQVCVQNLQTPVHINFDLNQNTPIMSTFFTILPSWIMRAGGDPSYVIYYESFPPGEGIGWETYLNYEHRLYVILPQEDPDKGGDWGIERVKEYVDDKVEKFQDANKEIQVDGAIVANIMLSNYSGMNIPILDVEKEFSSVGKDTAESTQLEKQGSEALPGFGNWQSQKDYTERDYFRFDNYAGLSTIEKTLIKYQSCGPQSLCLKTKGGVYRFPLNCNDIKTVQLVYDARNRKAIYGTLIVLGVLSQVPAAGAGAAGGTGGGSILTSIFSWVGPKLGTLAMFSLKHPFLATALFSGPIYNAASEALTAMFGIKTGDLVIASPCSLQDVQILKTDCGKIEVKKGLDYKPCAGYIRYAIMEYHGETGKITPMKDDNGQIYYHYVCSDRIETKPEGKPIQTAMTQGGPEYFTLDQPTGKCIVVETAIQPKPFCWTADPSGNDDIDWSDSSALANLMGIVPVRQAVQFFPQDNQITLRPTNVEELNKFLNMVANKVSWAWPGFTYTGPAAFVYHKVAGD